MYSRTLLTALLLAVGLLIPSVGHAQWVFMSHEDDSLVTVGLDAMYNLRYQEADSTFATLVSHDPEHPVGYFLQALVEWWRIVPNISVDSKVDRFSKQFNDRIDKCIEVCDARLDKNPGDIVALFFKGSALGYRARLVTTRNLSSGNMLSMVSGAMDGKEALDILMMCQRLAPSNKDLLLGSGLFQYLSAYIRDEKPALKPMLGFLPPGDKQLGLTMLKLAADKARYANVEAKYSLLEIYALMEKNQGAALDLARELYKAYPGNAVFHKYLARSLYLQGYYAEAADEWTSILHSVEAREPGYELTLARQGTYYLGDIRLRQGNFESALKLFQQSDRLTDRFDDDESSSWHVMANLKMGYVYDKIGRRTEALRQYRRVLDLDNYNDSHEKAEQALQTPYQ